MSQLRKMYQGRWDFGNFEMTSYETTEEKLMSLMESEFYKFVDLDADTPTTWRFHTDMTPREYWNHYKDEINVSQVFVGFTEIR